MSKLSEYIRLEQAIKTATPDVLQAADGTQLAAIGDGGGLYLINRRINANDVPRLLAWLKDLLEESEPEKTSEQPATTCVVGWDYDKQVWVTSCNYYLLKRPDADMLFCKYCGGKRQTKEGIP